jgi:hypothetical protein
MAYRHVPIRPEFKLAPSSPVRGWAGTARGARQGVRRQGPKSLNTETNFPLGDEPESFWRDITLTRAECTSEKVMRLHDYWQELRAARAMPARRDIDAVQVWSLLPYIHVSEWHENPDRVRYRVAGTEVVASIGKEISGHWLTDFHTDPKDVDETMRLYRQVIAQRAPIMGRTLGSMQRLGVDSFEWILCPLSEDNSAVTHFIGLEDYVSNRRYLGAGS